MQVHILDLYYSGKASDIRGFGSIENRLTASMVTMLMDLSFLTLA